MREVVAATLRGAPPRYIRHTVGIAAAWMLFMAMSIMGALPAAAHEQLVSSNPADGDVIAHELETITLTFSGEPLETGTAIVLTGSDGAEVPLTDISANGQQVTGKIPASLPNGEYNVSWHVVAEDGHPLEGTFSFIVDAPGTDDALEPPVSKDAPGHEGDSESAQPLPQPESDDSGSSAETLSSAHDQAESSDSATSQADTSGGFSGPLVVMLAIIGGVVVLIGLLAVMWRKMKDNEDMRQRGGDAGTGGSGDDGGSWGDSSGSDSGGGGD